MTENNTPEPQTPQNPAQQDAERLKRAYPLSFLIKLLSVLLIVFIIMCIVIYIASGTSRGTRFIVEKIVSETGVDVVYSKGNLRDGLLIKDLTLSASENIDVHLLDTYVKIGWRAIFTKQLHLRDATINEIKITNKKPPTGEPFDYKTLDLPVNLRFDKTRISTITYNQTGREPILVKDVKADDLNWIGSKVEIGDAYFQYADIVKIANLNGFINLKDDYPLNLNATVTVNSLEKHYIDPFKIKATGSLKRTYGEIKSKYNNDNISGKFIVQGVDTGSPFEAKLNWDEVTIPYAKDQEITLYKGRAIASGVISDIQLRINSQLSAKNIPTGHYQGRARIANSQMHVDRLTVDSAQGNLIAQGILDWKDKFTVKAMLRSNGYQIRSILPESVASYAPQRFNGKLAVIYKNANDNGDMQIHADLKQRDGEHINAKVIQGKKPENPRFKAPWIINANWQHLIRKNVPQLDKINSASGIAEVTIRDNRLWATTKAQINELNVAPMGNYDLEIYKVNNKININGLNYNGEMGNMAGSGQVVLASNSKPLTWDIIAKSSELLPQAFNKNIPIKRLEGDIKAHGSMSNITKKVGRKTVKGQRHKFYIDSSDLNATLTSQVEVANTSASSNKIISKNRFLALNGAGDGAVDIIDGGFDAFDARFNGKLATQGLPKGDFIIDANGTAKLISLKTFSHSGEAGGLEGSGLIDLNKGVKWDLTARTNKLDLGFFTKKTNGVVTGDLETIGHWLNNNSEQSNLANLKSFDVKFNGVYDSPDLPAGNLIIDAGGNASAIKLRKLSHAGNAGNVSANGLLSIKDGVAWNISAVMNNYNVSYFIKDLPSHLTGRLSSKGSWSNSEQQIQIKQLALKGDLNNKPFLARGSLDANLNLPKNMSNYIELLKKADASDQVNQVKSIIKSINADNILVKWADNQVAIDGNTQKLQAKVNITNLREVYDQFSGTMQGGFTLVQPQSKALPTVYVDLKGEKVALPGFILNKGVVKGKIVDLGKSNSNLMVIADGLEIGNNYFKNVEALFKGTEKSHLLTVKGNTVSNKTDVAIKALLKGGLDRKVNQWRGILGKGAIATNYVSLAQKQPAEILVDFSDSSTSFNLAAHCWEATDQQGKLCLRENLIASAEQGQINFVIQKLDTTLVAPFLPKDLTWQAQVNGTGIVGWQKGKMPNINATLYSDNGKVGMVQEGSDQVVTLPYKRVSLIAKSFPEGLKLRTDIDSGRGARGYADIVVDPSKKDKPLSGALVLNEFNLAIVKPFFPGMRILKGNVTMAGGLGGTLNSPVFYGDVNLRDASFAMLDFPINLNNINAKARVRGQNATLQGTFMSGEGQGDLSGTIDWSQELQAKIRVQGDRLIISQPPALFAEVSPDLNVIVKPMQKYINVVGAVSVPTATIRPPEANEKVVTRSEDVVVLDRRLVGNIEEVLAITKPWSINADIGVDLGSDVNFQGFGATLPLAGAIHLTQQGQGVMNAKGVVQVSRRSSVDALGQSLDLNYGQVRFEGDVLNPRLSIEAIKEIEGQTVGIRVKNNVSNPNIIVFNDAGLTQQQAMNALVTGRISNPGATQISEEGFKSEVTNNLAAAGLSYGLSGTRSLTNSIGQAFGLQRLTLDATGTENDTHVNVTGYITPDLYIRYGVGVFNAESTLSLRYQLTNRIYVEATSATENAIDVVYSFKF